MQKCITPNSLVPRFNYPHEYVAIGFSTVAVVPSNTRAMMRIFSNVGGGQVWIGAGEEPDPTRVIHILDAATTKAMKFADYGALVCLPFWAFAVGAPSALSVTTIEFQ